MFGRFLPLNFDFVSVKWQDHSSPLRVDPSIYCERSSLKLFRALSPFFFIGILPPFTFFLRGLAIFMHFLHVCILFFHLFAFYCLWIRLNPLKRVEPYWFKTLRSGIPLFSGSSSFSFFSFYFANFTFRVQMETFHPTVLGSAHCQGMMLQVLFYRVLKVSIFVCSTILACLAFLLLFFC